MGLDDLSYILVVEELAKYDASHAITVSAHTTLGTSPVLTFGTEEQKRRFVPPLASGEVLGGFGLTEPGAGSDASGTRTRAVREGGGYRINGSKIFITHAGVGEIFTVTAVTDPERGRPGHHQLPRVQAHGGPGTRPRDRLRPQGRPSLHRGGPGRQEGGQDGLARVRHPRAPPGGRLGARRSNAWARKAQGFINFMKTLDAGRIGVAALSLGLAQGAFEAAVRYADEREQFGKRIWDFQQIQFRLADLATDLEAGRHLTYHAAWLKGRGEPFSKEAAMAKLFCSELAMRATLDAIQILGGAGYTSEYPVERMMRDAKVCEIGEGTNEIQRMVIGRHVLAEVLADPSCSHPSLRPLEPAGAMSS